MICQDHCLVNKNLFITPPRFAGMRISHSSNNIELATISSVPQSYATKKFHDHNSSTKLGFLSPSNSRIQKYEPIEQILY
ncbi:hypothetical protein Leryth_024607 [Lithospermum erythrorhizon]|nr:hypothetical protein Leryth_024607 [Lithospermum erythrorhizon]